MGFGDSRTYYESFSKNVLCILLSFSQIMFPVHAKAHAQLNGLVIPIVAALVGPLV